MANMFSGNNETQIPRNLSECTKVNATVTNLHNWSERLEKWGKILFWIIVIFGIIVSIVEMSETQELRQLYRDSLKEYMELPSELEVFLNKLLTWGFYAFLEYCAYHVLALLISALASITQNTIISANVALYEASQNCASPVYTQTAIGIDSSNPTVQSPKPNAVQYVNHGSAPDGMWACKNCGTHNSLNYGQCKKCGKFKS